MSEFDILVQQVRVCTRCRLSEGRTNTVPGAGSRTADIVFIGEAPGYQEDKQGLPFVGPAGHLLDTLLASINLRRDDIYITNMVKCRPPNNRDPLPGEIEACRPYLNGQLDIIAPKIIVTLGRYSFAHFFPNEMISKARGKAREWEGIIIYPMFHPAAALHQAKYRPMLEQDFKNLETILKSDTPGQGGPEKEQGTQLSFF